MSSEPDYDQYTPEEILDAFRQVNDKLYPGRANALLVRVASIIQKDVMDIEMEDIVEFHSYPVYLDLESVGLKIGENYTMEAIEVREKLMRLKNAFKK